MKTKTLIVTPLLATLAFALTGAGTRAWAQAAPSSVDLIESYIVQTTFPFQAGGRILPAGKYVIEQPTQDHLIFRSSEGLAYDALVLTRTAQPVTPLVDAVVIFDEDHGMYYASEVAIPGHDGFLLKDSMVAVHTHVRVKAVKK